MAAEPNFALHEDLKFLLAHVVNDFMNFMKRQGLTMPQIHTLMYIYHRGECQVSDISQLADATMPAASQMVERLVQAGLVDRSEDPSNRRVKLLRLSEKGHELIRNSILSNHALLHNLSQLNASQRKTVHEAFSILAHSIGQGEFTHMGKEGKHA